MKPKVLFVCVENACRSQIAEGFAKKRGAGVLEAWSAGSRPSGKINETAVGLMLERGIDLTRQRSKGLASLPAMKWDYVVTMGCGDACADLEAGVRLEWDLPNPRDLPLEEFRKVRDEIEARVIRLIQDVLERQRDEPSRQTRHGRGARQKEGGN